MSSFSQNWVNPEILTAWAKMQRELEPAEKNAKNPHFRSTYANLTEIFRVGKKALYENGFCFSQHAETTPIGVEVETIIWYVKTGDWMSSRLTLKPMNDDPQKAGSCITYAKRYALAAILGIETEDDDGNDASDRNNSGGGIWKTDQKNNQVSDQNQTNQKPQPETSPPENKPEANRQPGMVTEKQIKRLFAIAKQNGWTDPEIKQFMKDSWNIESYSDLHYKKYNQLIELISKPKTLPEIQIGDLPPEIPF